MSEEFKTINFSSSSEYLREDNVQSAIMSDSNVAQIAHEFDHLHLKVEKEPTDTNKRSKAAKKEELIEAVKQYESNLSQVA